MAKTYARWFGIILLALGVVGLFAGNKLIGFNIELVEDLVHLVTGALLAYAGFKGTDEQTASWVKIIAVVYLVVGVLGFPFRTLFGLLPGGLGAPDNILHLALGVIGFWAARSYKAATA